MSASGTLLAFLEDTAGRYQHTLRFRDIATGRDYPERITGLGDTLAWANDGRTVYYVENHPVTLLSTRVKKHVLGTDPATDPVVYEEKDTSFYLRRCEERRPPVRADQAREHGCQRVLDDRRRRARPWAACSRPAPARLPLRRRPPRRALGDPDGLAGAQLPPDGGGRRRRRATAGGGRRSFPTTPRCSSSRWPSSATTSPSTSGAKAFSAFASCPGRSPGRHSSSRPTSPPTRRASPSTPSRTPTSSATPTPR